MSGATGERKEDEGIALQFKGVSKTYGAVVALTEIDLAVRKGEFLTLLGPSGSGKTTLLNIISGTIAPTSGRLLLGGRDITSLPSNQRRLGMVFQNYALFPHMTIFENIAFPLRVRRLPAAEIAQKVQNALSLVRLPDVGTRKPRELSGGQQQRIAIARCLVYNPDLILMDEPLGALDKKLREQMQLEIKRLHLDLGVTILYVTHDQEEALVMSDRVCLMNGGRIEQIGKPHDLYFRPSSVFAADFLGESNILPAVARHDANGVVVEAAGGLAMKGANDVAPGTSLNLMIRPENLVVLAAKNGNDAALSGRVEDVIFSGGVTRFRIRMRDDTLLTATRLTTAHDAALKHGTPVDVEWSPENVVLIR